MNRVVLTTGGTGGHIFPALAVAEEIRSRHPDVRILFVGGSQGPEGRLAGEAGLEFAALPVRGVLGRGLRSVGALFLLGCSVVRALLLLSRFKPDVILGFGGYAGFAAVQAGSLMRIPTAIHEQNSVPGVCNRILAQRVDKVLVSFSGQRERFQGADVVHTGNPVRKAIRALREQRRAPGRNLLVLGGSQGAQAINEAVVEALPALKAQDVRIRHQTGPARFEEVRKAYARVYPEAEVEPFIADMAAAYKEADLVLARAGATTIAELTVAGKPSVLVPFPYATHNHQFGNAKQLEEAGAAMTVVQSCLSEVRLGNMIGDLLSMPEKLEEMAAASGRLGRPDAARHVVDQLEELLEARA
jgi:UDP-N-acetylglucosamine--N-acetylmuramyl-(pentapeptide) pyrophosphoryl-undecaprenol N-acetylglucosamine transferase